MKIFISPPFGNYFDYFTMKSKIYKNENIEFIPIKGSFTLQKREGLLTQILKTLRYSLAYKGWVNKIGLRNPGINEAVKKYNDKKFENFILSVAVINKYEIPILLKTIPIDMDLEINVSCPNIDKNLNDIRIEKFINRYRRYCILKVSPLSEYSLIDHYYKKGFRQFHCCNTVPVKEGGLSGPAITKYTEKLTAYIKENYSDTTVICGGGIQSNKDIVNYKLVGGDHFALSSVIFSPYKFLKLLFEL